MTINFQQPEQPCLAGGLAAPANLVHAAVPRNVVDQGLLELPTSGPKNWLMSRHQPWVSLLGRWLSAYPLKVKLKCATPEG
jgi:hypothetical protein